MRVALIARGIGHQRAADHGCDIAVGINHAAAMYPCQWWCFCDFEAGRDITPQGSPQLPRFFTNDNARHRLSKRGIELDPARLTLWESVRGPDRVGWTVFSSCAAIVLIAGHLRLVHPTIESIECFGVYTVNFPQPVKDEDQRWITERHIWRQVTTWAGIPIVRR